MSVIEILRQPSSSASADSSAFIDLPRSPTQDLPLVIGQTISCLRVRHGRCSNEKGARLRARLGMGTKRKLRLLRRNQRDADRFAAFRE
jgi:hypothetical protein